MFLCELKFGFASTEATERQGSLFPLPWTSSMLAPFMESAQEEHIKFQKRLKKLVIQSEINIFSLPGNWVEWKHLCPPSPTDKVRTVILLQLESWSTERKMHAWSQTTGKVRFGPGVSWAITVLRKGWNPIKGPQSPFLSLSISQKKTALEPSWLPCLDIWERSA